MIIDMLFQYRDHLTQQLHNLLTRYEAVANDELMRLSESVFSDLRGVFALQDAILEQAGIKQPAFDVWEQDAMTLYEQLVLLHVDEPDNSYKEKLESLMLVIKNLSSPAYVTGMQEAQSRLDEDKLTLIHNKLEMLKMTVPTEIYS